MNVAVHWMLIGKDGRVAYDRYSTPTVSEDGRVITTKFEEDLQINAGDQMIGELFFQDDYEQEQDDQYDPT